MSPPHKEESNILINKRGTQCLLAIKSKKFNQSKSNKNRKK